MLKFTVLALIAVSSVNAQGDYHTSASKQFGDANRNVVLSGYGSQPANGPPTLGGAATFNANNHAASLGGSHTLGVGSQVTGSGSLNLANSGPHRLDANAFHTHNFPNHGKSFGTSGGGLGYTHANGHGLSGSVSHTPMFKQTETRVQGNVNLFKDRHSSLDAHVGRSQSFSPYGNSRPNHFGGITYQRRF
ncbi:attacin-A-like [Culicoides brevitarsis]|uniref:attacin-A-like n=1 Tax=Culicoides brevitarsis TaxID=469753 RepID=UPI00307B9395